MSTAFPARNALPRSRDVRRRALIITVVATTLLGFALSLTLRPSVRPAGAPTGVRFADLVKLSPRAAGTGAAQSEEVRTRFTQGVRMLQMQQYDYALTAFHQVLKLAPQLPEAHVNMGFAFLGLGQWQDAVSFFQSAIELRRDQMNAYYGLAMALARGGEMSRAIGAMQAYIHRAAEDDPFLPSAEAALAEWRSGVRPAEERSDASAAAAPR